MPQQYDVGSSDLFTKIQAVIDHVSSMTDVYALDLYRKLNGMVLDNEHQQTVVIILLADPPLPEQSRSKVINVGISIYGMVLTGRLCSGIICMVVSDCLCLCWPD